MFESRRCARAVGSIARVSTPRFRCTSCGNLTRFDVVSSRRTKAYFHFTTGGELAVEDEDVLDETIEQVTCRWCGPSGAVEQLPPVVAASDGDPR